MTNKDLPCATRACPHKSVCCKHGVDLSKAEAIRTAVCAGYCVFLLHNRCILHGTKYYPAVCRKFPLDNYLGGDPELCPSIKKRKNK